MADLVGQTLGKYQLLKRLGRGGMADVYQGYQPGLDRYVAVKVLHPHLSEDPDFITRFKREAKSVSELRHPNIVQVFDFDIQGEHYYMVMEHIEGGRTLKQLLKELSAKDERLPLDQAIDIIAKLSDALSYAHNLGMIHRDIKPANVLLPSLGRPVLGDFGIARLIGESGLTSSGSMVGTPAYMSPEQGRAERVDARSDIYSLGIVLYEMLTGRPPYDADTPYAIILKHIHDPLVPPHVLSDDIPANIERIVLKCLAKNTDDRFVSMADLRDALLATQSTRPEPSSIETIDTQSPVTASRSSGKTIEAQPQPSESKVPARRPLAVPKWSLAVGIVALIAIVSLIALASRPKPGDPGVAALIDNGYESAFTGGVDDAFNTFNQALNIEPDNSRALIGRGIAEMIRYGDGNLAAADFDRAEQLTPNDPYLFYGRGMLYSRGEDFYDSEASDAAFTRAIELCGDDNRICAASYYERAGVRFYNLGDAQAGLADMDAVVERLPIDYVYDSRSDLRFNAGDYEGALNDALQAYDLSQYSYYLIKAASRAILVGRPDVAVELYDRVLNEQPTPHDLVGRGYISWLTDDVEAARAAADTALDEAPRLIEANYLLGLILLDKDGEPQNALDQFEIFANESDPDRLYEASQPFFISEFGRNIYFDMARAQHALGNPDAALQLIDRSLADGNDYWPEPYIERGLILHEQNHRADARENFNMALDIAQGQNKTDLATDIRRFIAELTQ